ncbi:hypothetical protein QBC46DRAFT_411363 [Diplogelasinospora grovesii]|uniref:Uncharacterized protein n=1 Tax=Diplogelasinospora grovesii TaxID=303347 RepID=A0AAN6S103_9PEZI|nr:hypothetical protein QBC46DRAFT_411363 [Diplogelasinospora grovesii]
MLFQSILFKLSAFTAAVLAAPAVLDDAPTTNLTARSGNHYANVYSGSYCSGTDLGSTANFGCGGTCHYASDNIYSIFLDQDGTGNPKPTASLFSGTNCDGTQVASAGILSGEHSGCTNLNIPARSYYLYFNC